ncbi:hypothetical protein NL529_34735, partial [Klebsiella pneumoniae]|nr:hypothetical protein [Klebsiella pneumoniae]
PYAVSENGRESLPPIPAGGPVEQWLRTHRLLVWNTLAEMSRLPQAILTEVLGDQPGEAPLSLVSVPLFVGNELRAA